MVAGQCGSSQKAHDSTAATHREHFLTLVISSLIPLLLPFGLHLSEAADVRAFRPKSGLANFRACASSCSPPFPSLRRRGGRCLDPAAWLAPCADRDPSRALWIAIVRAQRVRC